MKFVNEALGKKTKVTRNDDDIKRDLDLQIARMDNDVSEFFEYQVKCLKKYCPFLTQVNQQSAFFNKSNENVYYIKDNGNINIRMIFDLNNSRKLVSMLKYCDLKIDTLYGDVNLENISSFIKFPDRFPRNLVGDLVLSEYIKSLNNAPTNVSGDVYMIVPNKYIENDIREYEEILDKNIIRKEKSVIKNAPQSIFNMKKINESFHQRSLFDLLHVKRNQLIKKKIY